jgi:hypothetical protein
MNTLDDIIESFATREPEEAAVRDAQRKLDDVVAGRMARENTRPQARRTGWLAAMASAAAVTAAVLWLSMQPTPAFATVQEHFRDFQTLRFLMEQRFDGKLIMRTRMLVTRSGNVRAEVGNDVTVIVNSAERRVLTLVHPSRMATVAPLVRQLEEDEALK